MEGASCGEFDDSEASSVAADPMDTTWSELLLVAVLLAVVVLSGKV